MTTKATVTSTSSAQAPSLATLVSRVRSGIVRIESDTCSGTSIGTGFKLAPRIVATVEHVVDGASAIRIKQGNRLVAMGSIIGADPSQDLALVLTNKAISGQSLALSANPPVLGDAVAAIGFPLGLPLSVTQGTVSGLGRTIPIDNYLRHNLVQTDAAVNPGNSGGPLMSLDTSKVVGLVDLKVTQESGLGFAVSASIAIKQVGYALRTTYAAI